jgi:hypothetical protein
MTTAAKIAIAAVIVAALAAVVGYDLLHGKPKNGDPENAPKTESGLTTIFNDVLARPNPAEAIHAAEQREAGTAGTPIVEPAGSPAILPPPLPVDPVPSNEEYVVLSGDLLSDIAERKYGDPNKWTLIAKANPTVNPSKLRIGTKRLARRPTRSRPATSCRRSRRSSMAAPPPPRRSRRPTPRP